MFEKFRLSLQLALCLSLIYLLVRPQKILQRFKGLTPLTARILITVALVALVAVNLASLPGTQTSQSQSKVELYEANLSSRIAAFPRAVREDVVTLSCQKEMFQAMSTAYPQLAKKTIDLSSMNICCCILAAVSDRPEISRARELAKSGKSWNEFADQVFLEIPNMSEIIKGCKNDT